MDAVSNNPPDKLLNKEFRVLEKGYVRLVDYMGSDESIVQAARVSYGAGTKSHSEDRSLIRYLMRHRHTSPFEMVEFKFHIKLPIFVARQWIRHRTASVNEYSGRYSIMPEEFHVPKLNDVRMQSLANKQGRSDISVSDFDGANFLAYLHRSQADSYSHYEEFLQIGIARELARICLPLSTYTEWYWKMDLHNLLHFLRLRLDVAAQSEIREYARTIAEIVKIICPLAYEAFEDYQLSSVTLSRVEALAISRLIDPALLTPGFFESIGLRSGELSEFREKLSRIKGDE